MSNIINTKMLQIDFLSKCWSLPCGPVCVFYLFHQMLNSRISNFETCAKMNQSPAAKVLIKETVDSLAKMESLLKRIKLFCGELPSGWKFFLARCIEQYALLVEGFNDKIATDYWFRAIEFETPATLIEKFQQNPSDWPQIKVLAESITTLYCTYLDVLDKIDAVDEFEGYWPNEALEVISMELQDLRKNFSSLSQTVIINPASPLQYQTCMTWLTQLQFLMNIFYELRSGQCYMVRETPSPKNPHLSLPTDADTPSV